MITSLSHVQNDATMTGSSWALLCSFVLKSMLYQGACCADDISADSTGWRTVLLKPALVLADTVLSTIILPTKPLRAPLSQRQPYSHTPPAFGNNAKNADAFDLPDDPIKKAAWRVTTAPKIRQKSAVPDRVFGTAPPSRRLHNEGGGFHGTKGRHSGLHSRYKIVKARMDPTQEPLVEGKYFPTKSSGIEEYLVRKLNAAVQWKGFPAQLTPFFLLAEGNVVPLNVHAVSSASARSKLTSRPIPKLGDVISARSYIVSFAREVGEFYGNPEKYGRCAADFVDQYLTPAGLTEELACLMAEVDNRDTVVVEETRHVSARRASAASSEEPAVGRKFNHARENLGKRVNATAAHQPSSRSSCRLLQATAFPTNAQAESSNVAVYQEEDSSPLKTRLRRFQVGSAKQDPVSDIGKLADTTVREKPTFSRLDMRLKEAFVTVAGALLKHSAGAALGMNDARGSAPEEKEEILRGTYAFENLSEETARFLIVSFAGEIGNLKGTPEEHVRLAEAFVERYLTPTGLTQYVARMIMAARREAEYPNMLPS